MLFGLVSNLTIALVVGYIYYNLGHRKGYVKGSRETFETCKNMFNSYHENTIRHYQRLHIIALNNQSDIDNPTIH